MGLETGTYVNDLNTANPVGTDAKSQGDDHLRLIKTCLKNSFPFSTMGTGLMKANGAAAAVTVASAADIVGYIGTTAVTNATNATNATNSTNATNLTGSGTVSSTATGTTQAWGTNNTTIATTAYVDRLRQVPASANTTIATSDVGKCLEVSTGVTIPNSTMEAGDVVSIFNNSAASITLTASITTLYQAGTANTGNRTLAQRGLCTIRFISGTVAVISGAGLS